MNITVRAIGPVAEALGSSTTKVELADGAMLGDLMQKLGRKNPDSHRFLWQEQGSGARFFRNGRALSLEECLEDGDCLDILLTIAGG